MRDWGTTRCFLHLVSLGTYFFRMTTLTAILISDLEQHNHCGMKSNQNCHLFDNIEYMPFPQNVTCIFSIWNVFVLFQINSISDCLAMIPQLRYLEQLILALIFDDSIWDWKRVMWCQRCPSVSFVHATYRRTWTYIVCYLTYKRVRDNEYCPWNKTLFSRTLFSRVIRGMARVNHSAFGWVVKITIVEAACKSGVVPKAWPKSQRHGQMAPILCFKSQKVMSKMLVSRSL